MLMLYCNRGIVNRKKGELARAIVDYHKAIELEPELTQAHANRALALDILRKEDRPMLKPDWISR